MDILKGPNKTVKETQSLILRIDRWRSKHVSDRQFLLLLAFVIGFLAAVSAWVLHFIIHQIKLLITSGFSITGINWLYLVYPIIGVRLTSLFIKYVVRDNISHGITRVLYAIATKKSHLKAPQHLVVGRGLGHHHRLWWIRGSRGPDRPDGIGHWLQPRPALPFGAQAADAPRGLWRLGSRGRHFQGPDSGTGLHDRDPDGRSDHGLAPAHPHLLGHGHLLLLPLHGRGLDVQFPYRRHLPARPSASHHPPGCGLWLRLHLLHAHDVVV